MPDERNILLSDALYNSVIKGSVSRFETFARCPHMHFLNYGMKLKPREVYEFNQMDMGVFAHEIMQISMEKLKDGYIDLANISDAETVKLHQILLAPYLINIHTLLKQTGDYSLRRAWKAVLTEVFWLTLPRLRVQDSCLTGLSRVICTIWLLKMVTEFHSVE